VGEFKDVNVGRNYQDLIVTGNYVLNWPLVLGTEVDNHIMVFCLERAELVAATPVDFGFEDTVTWNEPESIVEIEPGVFIASVTVVNDGVRMHRLYQTEVPMETTETPAETSSEPMAEMPLSTAGLFTSTTPYPPTEDALSTTPDGAEFESAPPAGTLLPDSLSIVHQEISVKPKEATGNSSRWQAMQQQMSTAIQATGQLLARGAQRMLSDTFLNVMVALLTLFTGFNLYRRSLQVKRERARMRRKSRRERDRFARMQREQEALEEQQETLEDIIHKYIEYHKLPIRIID